MHHSDISTFDELEYHYPRPWRVLELEGACDGIEAANGKMVVTTDSDVYGPGLFAASLIVQAVNLYRAT